MRLRSGKRIFNQEIVGDISMNQNKNQGKVEDLEKDQAEQSNNKDKEHLYDFYNDVKI